METRISRICDAIIEAGWLAALIVTPLFFNTYSSRTFEPDKQHLLRSIALIVAVAWLVQLLDVGWRRTHDGGPGLWARIRTTPLVLPALALVLAYIISTATSIVPGISLWGSYVRMQGTFSFLSYVLLFGAVLTHLRTRSQIDRLIFTVIVTSIPIAIYGVIQARGIDPLPWAGSVQDRVAANMGNAIFVAAYLIMAFFLTLGRAVDGVRVMLSEHGRAADALRTGVYICAALLQALCIILTQSRGPWLGWGAGLAIFALLGILLLARRAAHRLEGGWRWGWPALWFGFVALIVAGVAFVIVINLPRGPLASLREKPYIGRMTTLLSTTEGTNAVRVLIWEGVVDMMLKPHPAIQFPNGTPDALNAIRPLIGYGPESMWVAYNGFYPPDLAHYEARNASPDRSHNDTFDALVRTGFLGLAAQLVLFGSVFYFSLKWLGLMARRWSRWLFLGLIVACSIVATAGLSLWDGSLRMAGVGLPAGFVAGLVLYVIIYGSVDLVAALKPNGSAPAAADPGVESAPSVGLGRQFLILSVFAALAAHFVEVHFGIAIVSTMTHFWTLAGVLVVLGLGLDLATNTGLAGKPAEAHGRAAGPALAMNMAGSGMAPGAAVTAAVAAPAAVVSSVAQPPSRQKSARGKRAERSEAARQAAGPRGGRTPQARERAVPERSSLWTSLLPYTMIAAIVTMVITWDYLLNQVGESSPLAILWDAFTMRINPATRAPMVSPAVLVLLLFTWLIAGLLALTEGAVEPGQEGKPYPWLKHAALYVAVVVVVFFVYGMLRASQISPAVALASDRMAPYRHVADYIVGFDVTLLIMFAAAAWALTRADRRPRVNRWLGDMPLAPIVGGVAAAAIALVLIITVNIRTVQADTYYKQGVGYEENGQYDAAIMLYDQAALHEPNEDYYYLFLGRALLEFSSSLPQTGTASLPVDASKVATADLLVQADALLSRYLAGQATPNQEEVMRAAHLVLEGAQRLNPLNTDHTANLARLYRAWAFAKAVNPADQNNNNALRQAVQTHPDLVDKAKLDLSETYYQEAVTLSPHNAQLWNEKASVEYVQGNNQAAVASLQQSLQLDQQFYQTYLVLGDVQNAAGNKGAALDAFRKAASLRPTDISVLGVAGVGEAQLGDVDGAVSAFDKIVELETPAWKSAQSSLDQFNAQVTRAGGIDKMPAGSDVRQQSLQNNLATHSNTLFNTYRNKAVVLRDANRIGEALTAAQAALPLANSDQQASIQQLISDLQKRQAG